MYYVDTCIWLNLFKKEGDSRKGKPYWQIAGEFFQEIKQRGIEIYVSDAVLKELKSTLGDDYQKFESIFKEECIIMIESSEDDRVSARKLEVDCLLGFADCLHIAISKKRDLVLVTRDKDLLDFTRNIIVAEKPETILNRLSYV